MSEERGGQAEESVERQLERIESIVEELATDGIALDTALRLFEEGIGRLRTVTEHLAAAETRVKLLSEEAEGSFVLEELDD
jgi:exodeoxyribonuclease VII small subunit